MGYYSDGVLQGGGGSSLTTSQELVFDHLKFNPASDQLEADREFETILASFKLGKQWTMSSGGEQIYFKSTSLGTNNYFASGSIKDQSIIANQDATGIVHPNIRTLADNLIFVEPLGAADTSGVVGHEVGVTTTSPGAVFSIEVIVEENIVPTDWVAYEIFFGTDNTGIKIFLQHLTGLTKVPGDSLRIDFNQPIDRETGRQIFAQFVKKPTRDGAPSILQTRRSLGTPALGWFRMGMRPFTDTRIADRGYVHKMLLGQSLGDLFTGEVEFHADLPLASTASGQIWRVMKRTANYFTLGMSSRFLAGYYESDGTNWMLRPNAALPTYDASDPRLDTWKTTNYRTMTPNDIVKIFRMSIHGLNEDPDSVFMGMGALGSTTTGTSNAALGTDAGGSLTSGSDNMFIGFNAGLVATTASSNVGIGRNSLLALTTGKDNVSIGQRALGFITNGIRNVAIGSDALRKSRASETVAVGYLALTNLTTGEFNVAIGFQTLVNNLTGNGNVAVGWNALQKTTSGSNVAVGQEALKENLVGSQTAVGCQAMFNNRTGLRNTALGFTALSLNATQSDNTALGYEALKFATASGNTAVGARVLAAAGLTGSDNTAMGRDAGNLLTTGANNIILGAGAQLDGPTLSNWTMIGTPATVNARIYGTNFSLHDGTRSRVGVNPTDTSLFSPDGSQVLKVDNTGGFLNGVPLSTPTFTALQLETLIQTSGQSADFGPATPGDNIVQVTGIPTFTAIEAGIYEFNISARIFNITSSTASDSYYIGLFVDGVRDVLIQNRYIGVGTSSERTNVYAVITRTLTAGQTVDFGFSHDAADTISNIEKMKVICKQLATTTLAIGAATTVVGPPTSIVDRVVTFGDTTGELLKQSGVSIVGGAVSGITSLVVDSMTLDGTTLTGLATLNGFTALGSGNVAIKIKRVTGTTHSSSGGTVSVAHGLTLSKIIGFQTLVDATNGERYPPGFTFGGGFEYHVKLNTSFITVSNKTALSANIFSRPFTATITYVA